jgi:hypothetical protein
MPARQGIAGCTPIFLGMRAARKLRIAGMQPAILAVWVARTLATAFSEGRYLVVKII